MGCHTIRVRLNFWTPQQPVWCDGGGGGQNSQVENYFLSAFDNSGLGLVKNTCIYYVCV